MKLETRVHVVGVGTIGEPVLRLLLRHRDAFGISRLSFHKRSARRSEVPKLASLIKAGAELAAAPDTAADFRFQGLTPTLSVEEALEGADVILDCSEDALGRRSEYSK